MFSYLCLYLLQAKERKSELAPPPLFHLLHAVDLDKKSQNVSVRLFSDTCARVEQMDFKSNSVSLILLEPIYWKILNVFNFFLGWQSSSVEIGNRLQIGRVEHLNLSCTVEKSRTSVNNVRKHLKTHSGEKFILETVCKLAG